MRGGIPTQQWQHLAVGPSHQDVSNGVFLSLLAMKAHCTCILQCYRPFITLSCVVFLFYHILLGIHGFNYTDSKAECRHLKNFTCKGTLRQVFLRAYRLEIQSVMLVFSTQLCERCPSNILSGLTTEYTE